MKNRRSMLLLIVLSLGLATAPRASEYTTTSAADKTETAIPFELINRHILLKIKVNNSDPLWFIFDTGDRFAIIDLERARSMGLKLQGEINVGGAGAGLLKGAYVKDSSFTVPGLEGFTQPVTLALPLGMLEPNFGHDVDGIIGSDFIKQFVVEVDYPARLIRLHDKQGFAYSGPGEPVPITFNQGGHPVVQAEMMLQGRDPIKGDCVIDLGSGGALALHRPFVEEHRLPPPEQKTIRAMGAGGTGGEITGRLGRISGLKIGKYTIDNPITMFSTDTKGAFANSAIQGNIGTQIMSKFRVFLDYDRNKIILEPNSDFKKPLDHASSGLKILGEGKDYRTFRVKEVLEDSPGTEASLQKNDLIITINERSASEFTLTELLQQFERPVPYKLTVRRAEQTLQVTLTPRKLV
ncbi:MAG TPA: aspartyl protease family protein [Blastocatellia bacterium]|nr:aspartyl protease family protein [Blastocatellia bacterium]